MRSALTFLATILAALTFTAPAHATVWGLGDQATAFFTDPRWDELPLKHVRTLVEWDTPSAPAKIAKLDAWMQLAQSTGSVPLLAIDRSITPGREKAKPTVAKYRALISWLRGRYPWWNQLTPWNEANGRLEPTYKNPKLAWQYYVAAKAVCKGCVVTSPVVLYGKGASEKWLAPFLKLGGKRIRLWAFHDYGDFNRKTDAALKRFERQVKGRIWMTEAAGWVRFLSDAKWPYNPQRAASVIDYTFKTVKKHPRITAVYWWQWLGTPGTNVRWDTGFFNPDGTERPGYLALKRGLGVQ